jgi:hypothetical protein
VKSAAQRVQAHFAGRHELLPHADERVAQCEELEDVILVAYVGREKRRLLTIEKVAGEWTLADVRTRKNPAQVAHNLERGFGDRPQFHFTNEEHHVVRVPLTDRQKALKYYNLLGW